MANVILKNSKYRLLIIFMLRHRRAASADLYKSRDYVFRFWYWKTEPAYFVYNWNQFGARMSYDNYSIIFSKKKERTKS